MDYSGMPKPLAKCIQETTKDMLRTIATQDISEACIAYIRESNVAVGAWVKEYARRTQGPELVVLHATFTYGVLATIEAWQRQMPVIVEPMVAQDVLDNINDPEFLQEAALRMQRRHGFVYEGMKNCAATVARNTTCQHILNAVVGVHEMILAQIEREEFLKLDENLIK